MPGISLFLQFMMLEVEWSRMMQMERSADVECMPFCGEGLSEGGAGALQERSRSRTCGEWGVAALRQSAYGF